VIKTLNKSDIDEFEIEAQELRRKSAKLITTETMSLIEILQNHYSSIEF